MTEDLYDLLKDLDKKNKVNLINLAFSVKDPERIPTGSLGLDIALGGGWPMGRLVTLWGKKGSTKSTLSLWAIASAQKMGKKCLYVDAEKSFTAEWAEANGVDVSQLVVLQTRSLETILDYLSKSKGFIDVLVIDSISVVNTTKYYDDDNHGMGIQARVTKELISKIEYWHPNALVIAISQVSMKVQGSGAQGKLVQSFTGGYALEHQSGIIVHLWVASKQTDIIMETISSGEDKTVTKYIGTVVTWSIDASKVSRPFVQGKYRFLAGLGNDPRFEVISLAERYGMTEKHGGWIHYDGNKWNGINQALEALTDVDLLERMKSEILEAAKRA